MHEIHFLIKNFGNYIGTQDPILLKPLTILTGRNGQGKSVLLDAIKSTLVLDKRLLKQSFNPKSPKRAESINEYLDVKSFFQNETNNGFQDLILKPNIICFHFKSNTIGYLFGTVWMGPNSKETYFIKSSISLEDSVKSMKECISDLTFFEMLNKSSNDYFRKYSLISEYCTDLHKYNLIFYFPKGITNEREFRNYLQILNESIISLTGNSKIDEKILQHQMFWPQEEEKILQESLNNLENAIREYNSYSERLSNEDSKLKKLIGIRNVYHEFYFDYFLKIRLIENNLNERKINISNENIESIEIKINENWDKISTFNEKMKANSEEKLKLEKLSENYRKISDLLLSIISKKKARPSMHKDLQIIFDRIIKLGKKIDQSRKHIIENHSELRRLKTEVIKNEETKTNISVFKSDNSDS